MRSFIFLLLFSWSFLGHAQVFDRLYQDSPQPALVQPLQWVAAARGSVNSPDAFAASPAWNFQPYTSSTVLPTSGTQEVWAKFSLAPTETPQTWFIRLPRLAVVRVSLFSHDERGNWQSVSAGESIAPAQWALRTRVPSFEVQTRSDTAQVYYLRFEHRIPITERPMLLSPFEYVDGASRVGTVIGVMWGMFTLLALLCVAAFSITRNRVFLWFGASVVTLMATQLVLIGYGGWRLWPQSVYLNQVMPWISAMLALASGAWFCAQASYAKGSHPRIYRVLAAIAAGSLLLACVIAVQPEFPPRLLRNLWVAASTCAIGAGLVWMSIRGHAWNRMLLLGSAPIGLATMGRLMYNVGLFRHVEIAQTAGVFSALVGLMWIFLALAWRSRESLLARERATALAAYDPATGLMLPHVIDIRLPQMLLRAGRVKPGCGILMMRWLEFPQSQGGRNAENGSAALARIGAILRAVARDVDTAVRYSEDEFMLMVEGPVNRNGLSQAATEILASCIRFSEKPETTLPLSLHIAIWHGGAGMHITDAVIGALRERLRQMATGTKRPVQFVDASTEGEVWPDEDKDRRKKDLLAKIDALEILHPPDSEPSSASLPAAPEGKSSATV